MKIITREYIQNNAGEKLDYYSKVGILLDRDVALLSSIYNCLKKSITYVPLNPEWPDYYINQIISETGIEVVIVNQKYSSRVLCSEVNIVDNSRVVNFAGEDNKNGIAYILYTSGSTGKPKGVKVTRDALLNFMEGIAEIIEFSPNKRIACLTTVSFDVFFLESTMALCKGLTVVLANEAEQRNPKLMAQLIVNNDVDMVQMTPSKMYLLLNHDKELRCLKTIKQIMIGGEPFPLSLLRTLKENTTAKIYNMYGPTETTIWSTVSDLTYKDQIDIGRPIKNTEIHVVDENLSILPMGQSGEICIAGKGLSKGYVGQVDLTADKFVCLPQQSDIKVYRTGDIGRYLPDGNLECLGRTDNQVKIRGHRIELEEIESHLNQFEGIKQSVVVSLEISKTDKILQAFYTSDTGIKSKTVSNYLSKRLPKYMLPVVFKHVESFIQTENEKIDRKRVLECIEIKAEESIVESSNISKLDDIQNKVFEVIVSTLDNKIGDAAIETELTGAGIDSITFINMVIALEDTFEFEFDDEMLLIAKFPTFKAVLEYVKSKIQ